MALRTFGRLWAPALLWLLLAVPAAAAAEERAGKGKKAKAAEEAPQEVPKEVPQEAPQEVPAGESLFDAPTDGEAWQAGESLFDAPTEEMPAGESLFDDDEVAAWKNKHETQEPEAAVNEVTFDSMVNKLTTDIVFDERGNVKEGGNSEIAFWHVTEINGDRYDEPTYGSAKLMEMIEQGEAYEVKFAPPSFNQFQCTEKVESMHQLLEPFSHELPAALIERAIATLADEGISNSKQLGELEEKDYDGIHIPALIKSRLRKIRAEAAKMSAVAETKVEMDSKEVEDELRKYMEDRDRSRAGDEKAPETQEAKQQTETSAQADAAVASEATPMEEEEDGTFKSLVWAVLNCPTCKGKETIECFRTCRYGGEIGGQKKDWSDCLGECIENRWLRATFAAMLPRS